MPLQATSGAASYDAFGGGVAAVPNYIEECFSTTLYTGNGSTQTINNGIDLAGKGGLVWMKNRTTAGDHHVLTDTVTGATKQLASNLTDPQYTYPGFGLTSFNSTGFTVTDNSTGSYYVNGSSKNYVGWAFREQPRFFDVVTYTGTGSARTIAHNLGSAPGCMIIKQLNTTRDWMVYHRSLGVGSNSEILLNFASAASGNGTATWNNTAPTDTVFTLGSGSSVNQSGGTYVAYLFAHNAGGFGLTGTDNVISCGSYAGTGSSGNNINLNYEPQWLLIKRTDTSGPGWLMFDTMRGWVNDPIIANGGDKFLYANSAAAEQDYYNNLAGDDFGSPTATGFVLNSASGATNGSGGTYIYVAIRRGPMKVPTIGTSVFGMDRYASGGGAGPVTGFVTDVQMLGQPAGDKGYFSPRLAGGNFMRTYDTAAESSQPNLIWDRMNGAWNSNVTGYMLWGWRRAPGFMDVVCYTGNGSARTINHNLAATPELMIVKRRNNISQWYCYVAPLGATGDVWLNNTNVADYTNNYWNGTSPTATVFSLSSLGSVNSSGAAYVAYLFTSCPGVSKVGSFTGTGATQVIDCGFTGGARFVLIKATSTTGDWYYWDSVRGIVPGNDPYLRMNSSANEVTNTDWVDTAATGFELSNAGGNLANTNGVTYIYLAIA